jgi:hypothetical protein
VIPWRLRQLSPAKKIFALSIIIIGLAFIIINFNAWNLFAKPIDLSMTENAVVRKVTLDSTNENMVLLDVKSMSSKTIEFNTVVIQDSNHITVATITSVSEDLPAYENSTIPINLNGINLVSGNYTANLWTTKSHVFYSPPFTVG